MGTQLELVLRAPGSNLQQLSIFLEPTEIPLAKRWVRELRRVLRGPHFLEKDQTFCGFPQTRRNELVLCEELNRTARLISGFRGPGPWEQGYAIQEHCTPENLSTELLNIYHHHFELLRGQAWKKSPYYEAVQKHYVIEDAIRKLNVLVHELEGLLLSRKQAASGERIFPFSVFHFLIPDCDIRLPLRDEDYDHFSFEEEFGLAQMIYCQVGKTHYQAWCDGDQEIMDENQNNLRYYSAGFVVHWGEFTKGIRSSDLFLQWLKETGVDLRHKNYFIDKNGQKQGLGFLNVARTPMRQFGGRSIPEIQDLLARHDDVYKIRLHENGKVVESVFDYRLSDSDYQQRIAYRFNFRDTSLLKRVARPLKKTSLYRALLRQ